MKRATIWVVASVLMAGAVVAVIFVAAVWLAVSDPGTRMLGGPAYVVDSGNLPNRAFLGIEFEREPLFPPVAETGVRL